MDEQINRVYQRGKDVMNLKEIAGYLGVHISTIYKYAQQGNIPAFKIGTDWRFPKKHIDEWINEKINTQNRTSN